MEVDHIEEEENVENNKVMGVLLLLLAAGTIVGMAIDKEAYWHIHNYITILLAALCGAILLKQK